MSTQVIIRDPFMHGYMIYGEENICQELIFTGHLLNCITLPYLTRVPYHVDVG